MSELIYVLVVAFVGYVAYTVLNDSKTGSGVDTHLSENSATEANQQATVESTDAVAKAAPAETLTSEKSDTAHANTGDEVKNPKTGEVSKIPNNYRFGKRWIKEALVAEGLLDRVYKNNEVDDAISTKAQDAMVALKNLDKYRV